MPKVRLILLFGITNSAALRRTNAFPLRTGDHRSQLPRGTASEVVRLRDREIQALWKYTYRSRPWPSATDVANRWELIELAEKFWTEEGTDVTSRLDRVTQELSSRNNELYQIVEFYSVFQEILLASASQLTSTLTCDSCLVLLLLSLLSTVYTLIGYFLKFVQFRSKQIHAYELLEKRNVSIYFDLHMLTPGFDT